MAGTDQELEIKLWVKQPGKYQGYLEAHATRLIPRTYEQNLRFDDAQRSLSSQRKVLRLRQDQQVRLTFKGPGESLHGVQARQEIELVVDDFNTARRFLEALGYRVQLIYEKYRTTYQLGNVLVTLDEMPYGFFLELEGPTPDEIHQVCETLGLNWENRILESYTGLFERLKDTLRLDSRDLTFAELSQVDQPLETLQIKPADYPSLDA
jgi:adenylate cyclase class 2